MKVIFAQGNPEPKYTGTRHNVGFSVLSRYAKQMDTTFAPKSKFQADIAEATVGGDKILLVKPTTFYNETGLAARQIVDFYKLNPAEDLLVVHDDLALPLGMLRVRTSGSDAGNNGIKSLNTHLGPDYQRLRIGIYDNIHGRSSDIDFVLSRFNSAQAEQLELDVLPKAVELCDSFVRGRLDITSYNLMAK